jgi:hypothetical protein
LPAKLNEQTVTVAEGIIFLPPIKDGKFSLPEMNIELSFKIF